MSTLSIVLMLIAHLGVASSPERAIEYANVATLVLEATDDADRAHELVAIAIHETGATWPTDGGVDGDDCGPWQVRGGGCSAADALALVQWSESVCGKGDLSLYAGCRQCGACPAIVASLMDPTLPRR